MAKQVVVRGATLKCTGSGPVSFLMVLPTLMIVADGADVANIDDHKPVVNIIPFGPCSFKGGAPCVPVTPSPWSPGEMTVQFGLRPVLDVESHLKCELGGLITIQSSGQSTPFFSVDSEVSPLAAYAARREAQMRYAEAIKEQYDAENEAEHMSGWDIAWNTARETAKEASGYNDAGRSIDAFGRGDIGKGLLYAGMALPTPAGKAGKGVKAVHGVSEAVRAGRKARKGVGPIKGYTSHGINRSMSRNAGRGVHPAAILDATRNPKRVVPQSGGAKKYVGKNATVVVNSKGEVITAYGKPRGPQAYPKAGAGNKARRRAKALGLPYPAKKDIR
jgi:hypothetical protein